MKFTIEEKKNILKKFSIAFIFINILYALFEMITSDSLEIIVSDLIIFGIGIIINGIIFLLLKNYEKLKIPIVLLGLFNFFSGLIVFIAQIFVMVIELSADKSKKPKQLPKLEMNYPKKPYGFILAFILVFIVFYSSLLNYFNFSLDYNNIIMVLIMYGTEIIALIIPFRKDLIENFKSIKGNISVYLRYVFKMFGLIVLAQLSINLIIYALLGENSTNESALKELPFLTKAILAMLIAPFTEEVLFRGFIRKIIKNDKVFIIVSSLIFGLLHVWYVEENVLMYLYGITYVVMGAILARTYVKTNNIYTNIAVHSANNSIAILGEVVLRIMEGI